jgi:hypothetical protein
MSKKISPFVNPAVVYEQLFKNDGHIFEGRNQGRSISETPTEIDSYCLECFVRFGIIDRYPIPLSGNGDLPPLDVKYAKMKSKNYGTRAERETREMNERDFNEGILDRNPATEDTHW